MAAYRDFFWPCNCKTQDLSGYCIICNAKAIDSNPAGGSKKINGFPRFRKPVFVFMGFKPVEHAKRAKQKTTRYAGGIKLLYKNLTFPLE